MIRVLFIPTIFLLALGLLCFLLSATPLSYSEKTTITFCLGDEIKTLDPGRMSWMNDIRVAMCIWEGLTAYDPDTLAPVPGMAESWDVSPDGKTYTFHLRLDATWSNGDPVTSADFLFAWKRILTPSTGADYIGLFKGIVGAEAYTDVIDKKQPADFTAVGISAPDPHTLVVHLTAPCSYFLDMCAFPPFFPLNQKSMQPFLDSANPDAGYQSNWARPPYIVGNGPYLLREWKFKQFLTLEANPRYWDRKNVRCQQLLIKSITDPRTSLLAYQQGGVDVIQFPVNPQFGEDMLYANADGQRHDVFFRPVFGSYYFMFNCSRKPYDDKRVRKALALAIDRTRIVRDITRLQQQPLGVIVPPDFIPGYHSPDPLPMDIEEARRLLAEAGFPNGQGFPTIEILYSNEVLTHGFIAQAIGQMWEQNLGLHVTYRGTERSSFGEAKRSQNFDVARGGWYGDYLDPTTWLDILRSNDGNNDGKFSDPHYDALLNQAALEFNPAKRMAPLTQAEAILVHDQFPFIPLYQYSDGLIYDPTKIQGLSLNDRMLTPLKWIHRK
ncbi:MAG: peptide ABC transporter substrate-binding protein [Phycisphaerales bacterium]|nr:peptide ABC transporter substrate-binding protein [Phycisphaerales bacterium]